MHYYIRIHGCVTVIIVLALGGILPGAQSAQVSGELKAWHRVTLTFTGPQTSELDDVNPFLDYRLNVTFAKDAKRYIVPGFYAADGNAGQSSAGAGNKWRVHFVPDEPGQWSYSASLQTGKNAALSKSRNVGRIVFMEGQDGALDIAPTGQVGPGHVGRGFLRPTGQRYLQFANTGELFLKGGADSPENFLAYTDFDGTFDTADLKREGEAAGAKFVHSYEPHVRDFKEGDPTWKEGRGKGMIGALNYLASQGMNSVYFITYNIDGGDGKDVWPWIDPEERFRFDCSKLGQWEIVFSHMDRLGLALHIILQEQENDQGLDGGDLGLQRKLYFRELIARFAHHPALIWNLGEENTNTDEQRKAFCAYIKALDPYDHPIVCHTFPGKYDEAYTPLLGFTSFDGPSLQTKETHAQTIKWIDRSAAVGRPWFVCLDEIAEASVGVKPDQDDPQHDEVRHKHLWGNLMAGGAGVEWYFGYKFAHNDLNCEDWRSRHRMWALTRHALEFFHEHLPFAQMSHHDDLTSVRDDYCFARPGEIYAVYLPAGGTTELDLGNSTSRFAVKWFNPRTGGPLQEVGVILIKGPGSVTLGYPPQDRDRDWVALVTRVQDG
jgi:hypothetical protein